VIIIDKVRISGVVTFSLKMEVR